METFARQNFSDQLSIETPEGVALRFPVAGIGSRGIAALLDHIFQALSYVALGLLVYLWYVAVGEARFQRETERLSSAGAWFIAGIGIVFFVLYWGYWSLFEAFWRGQTPGKRIMKLRVIKDAGRQITLFEAMARNLLRIVDSFPSMYLTGVITMVCNRRNKRLGDLVAGTIVVHEGREEQPLLYTSFNTPSVYGSSPFHVEPTALSAPAAGAVANASGPFPADALSRLGPPDLLVIDTFFARALDLPIETRGAMAQRVLATLCGKMGVPVPGIHPERALEAILVGMRSGASRF